MVWIGCLLLAICLLVVLIGRGSEDGGYRNPWPDWIAKPVAWNSNPLAAFYEPERTNVIPGIVGAFLVGLVTFGGSSQFLGIRLGRFSAGFSIVFLLATVAYVLAGQKVIKAYNLEYALWALALGLLVSNTIGTASWIRPAVRTEFYITRNRSGALKP